MAGHQTQGLYILVRRRWDLLPHGGPVFLVSRDVFERSRQAFSTPVRCLSKGLGKEFRYTSAEISGVRFERFEK